MPDYFAERAAGPALVVDCRPADRRPPRDLAAFEATRRACALAGWEYRLTGALDPVATANLRWLAGYRHPRYGLPALAGAVRAAFAVPVPLVDGAEAAGDPIAVLPVLYHLLWRQELAADLSVGSGVGPGRASIASASKPPLAGARGDLVWLLPGPDTWARCAAATGRWSRASGPLDCISRCPGVPPLH